MKVKALSMLVSPEHSQGVANPLVQALSLSPSDRLGQTPCESPASSIPLLITLQCFDLRLGDCCSAFLGRGREVHIPLGHWVLGAHVLAIGFAVVFSAAPWTWRLRPRLLGAPTPTWVSLPGEQTVPFHSLGNKAVHWGNRGPKQDFNIFQN